VADQKNAGRREVLLKSVNVGVLASLFSFGAVDRPKDLGIQDYTAQGGGRTLGLCPKSPNCISTAGLDDDKHYVPPWQYNPEEGRGRTKPISQAEAVEELVQTVSSLKPDKFEPKLISRTDDYVYFEFSSPTFGFIDDVEFFFPGKDSTVEYRSASRIGESDGDINRKRIRDIRKALQQKGWKSIGY
jgi:uncharacterized protein (DUF1499 family)